MCNFSVLKPLSKHPPPGGTVMSFFIWMGGWGAGFKEVYITPRSLTCVVPTVHVQSFVQ